MSAKNPESSIHGFKMNCSKKIKKIESFIGSHESGSLTSEELDELKELNQALKDQFGRMEVRWDTMGDIDDEDVFKKLEKVVADTEKAVDGMLVVSKQFIKGIQISETAASPTGATARPVTRVKLPAFWTEECDLWFSNVEATFRTVNVTTEVHKFNQVVAQLDATTAAFARNIIEAEQKEEDQPYTRLKSRILEVLSLSCNEKADKLLDLNGFGDKTPSQGLQAMLKLVPAEEAGNPGFLFRRIFLRQLTPDVRNNLAQTEHTASAVDSLRQLAKQADRYYHSTGARINAVGASAEFSSDELGVDAVTGRVLCQYHAKYGRSAKKCEKSKGIRCDWTPKPPKKPQGNANGRA